MGDPSTLELIQLLVEQGATARLLLFYTARPEFHAQWPLRAHHTQVNLNRLSARNVREMITQVAARMRSPVKLWTRLSSALVECPCSSKN